jgi:hypothetical protein
MGEDRNDSSTPVLAPPSCTTRREINMTDVKTLHARNDGMIREADAAIAVYDQRKTEGGTASAVRKLARLGLPIIHVNPENRMTTLRTSGQRAA